jgi:hypothetical protein
MSRLIHLNSPETKPPQKPGAKLLPILAAVIGAAFILLLVVGFDNLLALLRYRVTLFLVMAPLVGLFFWCAYKAFGPQNKP